MSKQIKDLDLEIGSKIEKCRKSLRLSRKEVAEKLEITHQQLQKYESGVNRITVSRLVEIAKILKVNITYFFESLKEEVVNPEKDLIQEIIYIINQITDRKRLLSIKNLLKSMV